MSKRTPPSSLTMKRSHSNAFSPESLVSNTKLIETGVLEPVRSGNFVVCFDGEPIWLLALQPHFINNIYIDNSLQSLTDLMEYLSQFPNRLCLYNKIITKLSLKFKFNFSHHTLPTDVVVLVSGEAAHFELSISLYATFPVLFLYHEHCGRRKLPLCGCPLRRIKHIEVGGCTNFIAVVGLHNSSATPRTTTIRRNIRHFFGFFP